MAGCSEPVECGEKFCQHHLIIEFYEEDRKLDDSKQENI